jgi:translocation and assembly module TamB
MASEKPPRHWPRRVAISAAAVAVVLAGAWWYGGRETTLQMLVQKVANATGGQLVVTGVTGSLYGAMHVDRIVYRTPSQVMTIQDVSIDWAPWQYFSSGIAVSRLHAASVHSQTLSKSPPQAMPDSLAPPFRLSLSDVQVRRLELDGARIASLKLALDGSGSGWTLRDASAITEAGKLTASGHIASRKPFALNARSTLSARPGQLDLMLEGDLAATKATLRGAAGNAKGEALATLAPFEAVPLRTLTLRATGIDPGVFRPTLPHADMRAALDFQLTPAGLAKGSFSLINQGPEGTLDQQRLPLRAVSGKLAGNLEALTLSDMLLDFGSAGRFDGAGKLTRGDARFDLRTNRFDLKRLHSRLSSTAIAGSIALEGERDIQRARVDLRDKTLRLQADARLEKARLLIDNARVQAGKGTLAVQGQVALGGQQAFELKAQMTHFNPAALGQYPEGDLNAMFDMNGKLAPAWQANAAFTIRSSRLFGQNLSGKGRLTADAAHISEADARLDVGRNRAQVAGAFGKPGDQMAWRVDAPDLSALQLPVRGGALQASGALSGTMQAPASSFDAILRAGGTLKANGNVQLRPGQGLAVAAKGTAQQLDPAAFGARIKGSINAGFDITARAGKDWNANGSVVLQPSTLAGSPLRGLASLAASPGRVSNALVELQAGANTAHVRGGFGIPGQALEWRIDAPQLAALGPDFAGKLSGSGTITGTPEAPALVAAVSAADLRVPGHKVRSLKGNAQIGAGRGGADPVAIQLDAERYEGTAGRFDRVSLASSGTRSAHSIKVNASNERFQALAEVRGALTGDNWSGTVQALQNKGLYAFSLRAPVALELSGAAGSGAAGLARPVRIVLGDAVIALPQGAVTIAALEKNGARWRSRGSASGIPLSYVQQFSEDLRDTLGGDLTIGAQWQFDLLAAAGAAAPVLDGSLRLFREKGDIIAGADVPVALGLRQMELRAEVAHGALRTRFDMDGARGGRANVDATVMLAGGRLADSSPLRFTASADMGSIAWLSPLAGQPGLELDGRIKLSVTGGGSVGNPSLDGHVNGDGLALRWAEHGVKLRDGVLRAQLQGDQLRLQTLRFAGPQGHADISGQVRFAGSEATMQLKLDANKLELMSRPDRTVVVTGQATAVRDARRFDVTGRFRADRANIALAPLDRPTMSDDVIVLGRASNGKARTQNSATPFTLDIEADLGDDFQLEGMGLDAQLAGTVHLRAVERRPPRASGSIRVVKGTYAAYGQKLTIERGVLNFTGAYDNPGLNILAVRKRPEGEQLSETNVEAGVEVRGTALAPAARLVSTPNVPDSDKLAWLVLGHSMEATSGNEQGLLSAAAGALLGGKGGGLQSRIANSLGLDEVGLSSAKGLESTVLTVGKRLSQRAYLSFEQGAGTATSLVKLRYKLNPRITLQFQTGANTALDVLYSWSFD